VQRQDGTAGQLNESRPANPPKTGHPRGRQAAGTSIAILVVAAILVSACAASASSESATTAASAGSRVAATPSASPVSSPTMDPAGFAGDPRLASCGGLKAGVQEVVALDHAWAYRQVMPGIGFIPQFDASADPALIVVYSGPVPPQLDWRNFISRPPMPGPTTEPASPTPAPTPPPGTRNVCVEVTAADRPQIVENAPLEPFHPEMATLATRPAVQPGQGRVVNRESQLTYSLAWDQVHGVLWYTVQSSQTDSALVRLDPATGQTKRWALPATDYNGFMDNVVVDSTGAVWFDCTSAGGALYRLDPASGMLARHDVNLKVKPVVDQGGTYISAIAADGAGVLIARSSLPYLTRVDASLHEVGHIPIPAGYAGTTEVAVVGDLLALGGIPDNFALFSRQGKLITTLPIQRWHMIGGPSRLWPAGPGQAAAFGSSDLDVFDASGRIVTQVPMSLDLPRSAFADTGMFESGAQPQTIATDWHGTFWYALGTYIVEVRKS
jgi:hypothetical protein